MKKIPSVYLLVIAFAATTVASVAAPMTNADIIKMVEAKLDESIIMTAMENAEPKYDVSTQGLIELSNAKVPPAIVSAAIKRSAGSSAKPALAAGAMPSVASVAPSVESAMPSAPMDLMLPSEVIMLDGSENKTLRYINPQVRAAARALGFGGVASYAVLRGTAATARTKNATPEFLVSVPNQAQSESYLTLASFAVRKNNSREVLIGGGFMSYSSGIHPDRVMAVTMEKAADQSRAQKSFTIYKITPKQPLAAGEYAVILYTGEVQVGANWFTGTGNSYFDFGVDR